jgi:transcriptional regulator with XRE-family HTH domain
MLTQVNIARLREAANTAGHTRDGDIAEHAGLSPATISRIFNTDSSIEPKVSTLRILARAYGLTIDDLIVDPAKPSDAVA